MAILKRGYIFQTTILGSMLVFGGVKIMQSLELSTWFCLSFQHLKSSFTKWWQAHPQKFLAICRTSPARPSQSCVRLLPLTWCHPRPWRIPLGGWAYQCSLRRKTICYFKLLSNDMLKRSSYTNPIFSFLRGILKTQAISTQSVEKTSIV